MEKRQITIVIIIFGGLNCIMVALNAFLRDIAPGWVLILLSCVHVAIVITMVIFVVLQFKSAKNEKNN